MFDTFQGLPLHALVVHATVVLVPLMSLITVFVALRPGCASGTRGGRSWATCWSSRSST